ncbi:DUF1501 domain-containing protein, partial [bacterium]|nr:DUF1501 domain-containing protein [bacterium]
TFDPKPDAPREVRGELGAISTSVPGVQIGELLPQTARIIDRVTIVRSMTHPYPLHASAFTLTSIPTINVPLQMSPRDPRHWPFIGSVVDYLADQRGEPAPPIARNIGLPWRLSSRRAYAAGDNAGPYGAWLGRAYDPLWTDFEGKGTRVSTYTFDNKTIRCNDPYGPLEPDCRFGLAADATLPDGVTLDRLNRRRSLLEQFDDARRMIEANAATRSFDDFRQQAFSYLTTSTLSDALDVACEPAAMRERVAELRAEAGGVRPRLARLAGQLQNEGFLQNAPPAKVEEIKERLRAATEARDAALSRAEWIEERLC